MGADRLQTWMECTEEMEMEDWLDLIEGTVKELLSRVKELTVGGHITAGSGHRRAIENAQALKGSPIFQALTT